MTSNFKSDPEEDLTRRTVFLEVARLRVEEATILLESGHDLGAVYLAGYAVECQLKYVVCMRNEQIALPSQVQFGKQDRWHKLYTHQWDILVEAANFRNSIRRAPKIDALYSAMAAMWGPDLRYRTKKFKGAEGKRILRELLEIYHFLREEVP